MNRGLCGLGAAWLLWAACGAFAQGPEPLDPALGKPSEDGKTLWFDATLLGLEGQGWNDLKHPYDRFPAAAEGKVPDPVWRLSNHSAGLAVRFVTDSPTVAARWSLRSDNLDMNHMPATGVSGLDLYARRDGRWGWVAVGRPERQEANESVLTKAGPDGEQEYLLYLPLYNGTESLEIGIEPGRRLMKAPPYPAERAKPVLVWGTSIVQGGCASRPGMAYPAILGRRLNRPFINLGFSGNGKMDPEVTEFVTQVDAAAFVIDCAPNMPPELIAERAEPLARALREAHPATPIVFVENVHYQSGWFAEASRKAYEDKNAALRAAFDRLVAAGLGGLHYIEGANLLGSDHEATVDGTHPTDLGFLRMADAIEPTLKEVLGDSLHK
jgi:hypothetical protein